MTLGPRRRLRQVGEVGERSDEMVHFERREGLCLASLLRDCGPVVGQCRLGAAVLCPVKVVAPYPPAEGERPVRRRRSSCGTLPAACAFTPEALSAPLAETASVA